MPGGSDVLNRAGIAGDGMVVREQRHAFRDRLRDQKTVKRISMNIGQIANRRSVCRRHGQFAKARFFHAGY